MGSIAGARVSRVQVAYNNRIIIRKQPGVKPFVAARVSTVGDAWFKIFDNAMTDRVLQNTNSNEKCKTVFTKQEFITFVALHYLRGLQSKNISLTYFWSA